MLSHRPADDQPGEQVLDVREVQEPFPRRDVGDVRRPRPVRAVRAKVALHQVRSDPDPGQPDGGAPTLARQKPGETGRSHQPLDALASDADPVLEPQLGVDPPGAVGAVRVGVDLLDLLWSATRPSARGQTARDAASHESWCGSRPALCTSRRPESSPSPPRSARRSRLRLAGLPGEKSGCLLEDLTLHPQRLILTTQPRQLLTLITREAVRALAGMRSAGWALNRPSRPTSEDPPRSDAATCSRSERARSPHDETPVGTAVWFEALLTS